MMVEDHQKCDQWEKVIAVQKRRQQRIRIHTLNEGIWVHLCVTLRIAHKNYEFDEIYDKVPTGFEETGCHLNEKVMSVC